MSEMPCDGCYDLGQVWPICGDGLDLEVMLTPGRGGLSQQLMWREITPNAKDKPQRQKVRLGASSDRGDCDINTA